MTDVHVLGIRHHGPGSARSLVRALDALAPDLVLVEGPPEADALAGLAGDPGLVPPVAFLAYQESAVAAPAAGDAAAAAAVGAGPRAAFWPFAVFSPEWQAMRWAAEREVPLRFVDLPAAAHLALQHAVRSPEGPGAGGEALDDGEATSDGEPTSEGGVPVGPDGVRTDPLARLARAAGYGDPERWWEDVVEHRDGDLAVFEAVAEAMSALREGEEPSASDALREAHMRTELRAAVRSGARCVVVVCGAWHVPALTGKLPPAAQDAALLKPFLKEVGRAKATVTWVPWSHGRLSYRTGYGAGVDAPGWYHHLFTAPDQPVERWLVHVAALLRDEGVPVSSAHVIEGVRLATALAALRGRPATGLEEATEAVRAVLCDGDEVRLALVRERLEVGELLGSVPDSAPAGPLERDLAAQCKRLRLPREALARTLDLDLRKPVDLERSRLLHRLRLLRVRWGHPAGTRGNRGTFRESWELEWEPEFPVALVAAGVHGTTVAEAAAGRVLHDAAAADLPRLAGLVEECLLADLPAAVPGLLDALQDRAALGADVDALLDAIPALARTLRYGDVRGTGGDALGPVLTGLVTRARTALPGTVTGLDDDAAARLVPRLQEVSAAVTVLDREPAADGLRDEWLATLDRVADRADLHGLVAGWAARTLRDEQVAGPEHTQARLARYLSPASPTRSAAAFVEGFVGGNGLLLVHDGALLRLVDEWLTALSDDAFVQVLPLLRRTFATFAAPERRAVGERLAGRHLDESGEVPLDPARVAHVLPVLTTLLEAR